MGGADVVIDAVGAEAAGNAMQSLLAVKLLLQAAPRQRCTGDHSVKKGGISFPS
jgi:hypothetical protein